VEFYRSDASWGEAFNDNRRMLARLAAFVIWSLVAATAVFWALRFAARSPQAPPYAVAVGKSAPMRGDLTKLFGAAPIAAAAPEAAAPEAASRFKLVGVMAPRPDRSAEAPAYGLALIAVDGKPAKAFPVGSRLDTDLVLQSVGHRSASLGPAQGERSVLLELPALPPPATGVLPGPGAPPVVVPPSPPAMRMLPAPAAPAQPAPIMPSAPVMQPQPVPAAVPAPPPALPTADNFRSQ
jgi:general secretion pathway protein C